MPVSINGTGTVTGATSIAADIRTALKGVPAFRAVHNTGTDQQLPNATLTPILYNVVQKAFGTYDPATGRWTPSAAGWWQVSFTGLMNYSTATAWSAAFFSIMKNGTEYFRCSQVGSSPSSVYGSSGSTLVYMNGTTDYLQVAAYGNTNTSITPYVNSGAEGPKFNNVSAVLVVPDA